MDRTRALDQVKTAVFFDNNAAFLACLLNHLNFSWSKETETACVTDKMEFMINPEWFDKLSFKQRQFTLLHELWHIACLHGLRRGPRDPETWNKACDIRINNDIRKDSKFSSVCDAPTGVLFDPKYASDDWTEERIYDEIQKNSSKRSGGQGNGSGYAAQPWGTKNPVGSSEQVPIVQQAAAVAKFAGEVPGKIESILNEFLKPKLPWKNILRNYLQDKLDSEWSWQRPNRRYHDIYMPSMLPDEGRLISVAMFLDVSGSIQDEDVKRFMSELRYIHDEFKPKKLTAIQFDTIIQDEKVYHPDTVIKDLKIKGRGGTSYRQIHKWIMKNRPTLAIIFTDLWCEPMEPVGKGTDLIWIAKNTIADAPIGKTIHVDD